MGRDDLDAWFAKADDVLRTWHDSPDAMRSGSVNPDLDPELPYIPAGREIAFPLRRPPARRPGPLARLRRLLSGRPTTPGTRR